MRFLFVYIQYPTQSIKHIFGKKIIQKVNKSCTINTTTNRFFNGYIWVITLSRLIQEVLLLDNGDI